MIITIDGPSASGKTSVARLTAARLGIPYLSSGLLYRAIALILRLENIEADEIETVLGKYKLELKSSPEQNHVFLNGADVTSALHSLEIDSSVSAIAKRPSVREVVNRVLMSVEPPFVIDGRDIGSTVFPKAEYKFFLTATPEVRATRRVPERGSAYEAVLEDLIRRDNSDKNQSAPAPDAIMLDTTEMGLDDVVRFVIDSIG